MNIFEPGAKLLEKPIPENIFLVDPYVPQNSIVVLFGRPTLGKTAIAWNFAQAVQTGTAIWGLPVMQANVLFLELDMPEELAHVRWADAEPEFKPLFVAAFEPTTIDCLQFLSTHPDPRHRLIQDQLMALQDRYNFGLVCIDALREVVVGDLNSGGIPRRVYDAFRTIFPGASILFVHHEKKAQADRFGPLDSIQMAAGSMEFMNVAQIALQFHKVGKATYLSHIKTQASIKFDPLPLTICQDGVHLVNSNEERFKVAVEIIAKIVAANPTIGKRELDKALGKELGLSDRTARTIRKGLVQNGFVAL